MVIRNRPTKKFQKKNLVLVDKVLFLLPYNGYDILGNLGHSPAACGRKLYLKFSKIYFYNFG